MVPATLVAFGVGVARWKVEEPMPCRCTDWPAPGAGIFVAEPETALVTHPQETQLTFDSPAPRVKQAWPGSGRATESVSCPLTP